MMPGGLTLGEHGLDVAAPVLREDEVLGAAGLAQGALLGLRKAQDGRVQHRPVRLYDKLLGHLVRLHQNIG